MTGLITTTAGTAQKTRTAQLECVAAPTWDLQGGPYNLWAEDSWSATGDTVPRSPEYVRVRLAGHYSVLVVTNEGAGAKWVAHWSLQLVPTPPPQDSLWRSRWVHPTRPTFFPLVGLMTYRSGGHLQADGTLAPSPDGQEPGPDSVRIRYEPVAGLLQMETPPFDVLHGGGVYPVYEVAATGAFSGRWATETSGLRPIKTPLGTLVEPENGYFCATREPAPR